MYFFNGNIMQLEARLRLCQSCFWYCRRSQRLFSLSTVQRSKHNYYELLGVKPDATVEQIKIAFLNKSKKLHPDTDPSNPGLHTQFVELNEAYNVLSKNGPRQDYDSSLRYQYAGGQAFRPSSGSTYNPSSEAKENRRYWEQFRQAQPQGNSPEQNKIRKKRNMKLLGYCMLAMLISMAVHYGGYRILVQLHNNYMDKQDRICNEMINECVERARENGFQKQLEILKNNYAEIHKNNKIFHNGDEK